MWIVEFSYCYTDSKTGWNTKDEALAGACAIMMEIIHSNWNLKDSYVRSVAQTISDHCKNMNFQLAIDLVNGLTSQKVFKIYELHVQKNTPTIHLLSSTF